MVQDKAQSAENGRILFKDCNAVLDHPGGSLRADREVVVRRVAPLGKDLPFPARRASRPTASRSAETVTIALLGYLVLRCRWLNACESGGIGRRAGFRILWGNP